MTIAAISASKGSHPRSVIAGLERRIANYQANPHEKQNWKLGQGPTTDRWPNQRQGSIPKALMGHDSTFGELAQAVREVRTMQAGRLRYLEGLANSAAARGELPAFSLDGLRVQLVQLHRVESLLTTLAPVEAEVRRLAPSLVQGPRASVA
jgi:hypothetical protein